MPLVIKVLVVIGLLAVQVTFNIVTLHDSFLWYDVHYYGGEYKLGHCVVLCIALLASSVVLYIINRQVRLVNCHCVY